MHFEIQTPMVDVTQGGIFGGTPDTQRVFLPGVPLFFVDGAEVSEAEFVRLWAIDHPDQPLPAVEDREP
jgi:hypothetical protein